MPAAIVNLEIEQGSTFRKQFLWRDANGNPVNLTGATAHMQVRATYGTTVLLDLSTSNGGITLGGSAGTITLFLSPTATAAYTTPTALYDLDILEASGDVTRLFEGTFSLDKTITVNP